MNPRVMLGLLSIAALAASCDLVLGTDQPETPSKRYRVVIVVAEGYQEQEFWFPYYRFREEGADVIVAGPETGPVCGAGLHGKDGLPAVASITIEEVAQKPFDVLYIPGGLWAATTLRGYQPMLNLVRKSLKEERVVATIGHAACILISAYQVKGRTVAAPLEMSTGPPQRRSLLRGQRRGSRRESRYRRWS